MRVMMVISYDGKLFHGFQRQNNVRNVQGSLEEVLKAYFKEDIKVKGSGRTDARVHAKYQVIHFDTHGNIKGLKKYLKDNLKDIKIKKIRKVDENFHARFSVKDKVYLYKIDLKGKSDPNYFGIVKSKLDIKKMREASKVFIGYHDFHNFTSGIRIDYHSTIKSIYIYKIGSTLYLRFKGVAFYRYMVRNLVGALVWVGKCKGTKEDLEAMLNNKEEKRLPTASPSGLYLMKVNY